MCWIGDILEGQSGSMIFTASIAPLDRTPLVWTATIAGWYGDPQTANNTVVATIAPWTPEPIAFVSPIS